MFAYKLTQNSTQVPTNEIYLELSTYVQVNSRITLTNRATNHVLAKNERMTKVRMNVQEGPDMVEEDVEVYPGRFKCWDC